MNCSTPGLPVHHQLPEFTQTHIHWVSDAIQPSHLLSSPFPPALNPSQHQTLFQWVNSSHEVAKVLEFQLSIIPSKEIPGLVSFRMDWLYLLLFQGTLKSLFQHHSSVQFSSDAQSCPTLCDSMNRSTPGLPVYHQLLYTVMYTYNSCNIGYDRNIIGKNNIWLHIRSIF